MLQASEIKSNENKDINIKIEHCNFEISQVENPEGKTIQRCK